MQLGRQLGFLKDPDVSVDSEDDVVRHWFRLSLEIVDSFDDGNDAVLPEDSLS